MRQLPVALIALSFCTAPARAERVFFTTRIPWASPVLISSPFTSKQFGFESVILRNTSTKVIEALDLKVVLSTTGSAEEEVDGGRIHVSLEPGQAKRADVYLGQIKALQQKAHSLRLDTAVIVLFIASADFADGSRWNGDEAAPPIDFPVQPAGLRK
jgi:hypothetical protein